MKQLWTIITLAALTFTLHAADPATQLASSGTNKVVGTTIPQSADGPNELAARLGWAVSTQGVVSISKDFHSYQLLTILTNAAATSTVYALATNTVCTRDSQGGYLKYVRVSGLTNVALTFHFSTRPWQTPTLGAQWTNNPVGDGATNAFGYPVTIASYVTNFVNHIGGTTVDFPFICSGTNREIYTLIQCTDGTAKTNAAATLNYTIGGMLD